MNQNKLDLLREALPYIQKFKGKTFVVKFSGKVTEDKENLASLAEELALLHQVGIKICVVHGGGYPSRSASARHQCGRFERR
jgi:acetylglutamate kinase